MFTFELRQNTPISTEYTYCLLILILVYVTLQSGRLVLSVEAATNYTLNRWTSIPPKFHLNLLTYFPSTPPIYIHQPKLKFGEVDFVSMLGQLGCLRIGSASSKRDLVEFACYWRTSTAIIAHGIIL